MNRKKAVIMEGHDKKSTINNTIETKYNSENLSNI